MVDWSAIYMHTVVGRTKAFSALAVGTFATAMTIGRLFGDYFIDRMGRRFMLLFSCFAAIIGMSEALLLPSPLPIGALLRGDPDEGKGQEQDQGDQTAYGKSREPAGGGSGHECLDCYPELTCPGRAPRSYALGPSRIT